MRGPGFDRSAMVDALRRLVEAESFSSDPVGLEACAAVLAGLCAEVTGREPERAGRCLVWRRPGERPVLVLGHYDTVWPPGTLAELPFTVEDGVARGPGVFDMKAGIVQGVFAAGATHGPLTLLLTADEEVGSPASRSLVEREARGARAALVLEPSGEGGALKVARKGVAHWAVRVRGRAAHAGLEPEKGVSAIDELSRQMDAIRALARPEAGTTVTITMVGGGSAENVVPESAWCRVDARTWTREEMERLEAAMRSLRPHRSGAELTVVGGRNRLPLERASSEPLYRRLRALGYDPGAVEAGGGSDGNFTAALGVPTLDGLGAVGGGAHARDEHVIVDEMPRRAEMLARLIEDLVHHG